MMLRATAYVDDSGSSPEQIEPLGHFVLAGYVMRVPLWEDFSDRWAYELNHRPAIKCFKMRDAESGEGLFKGMPQEFRQLKINELSQIISDYEPLAIVASLKWEEYRQIAQGNVPEQMDSPYAVLFYQIMRSCHEFQIELKRREPETEYRKVDFAFDDQGKVGWRALQWYAALESRLREPYKSMMGNTPIFRTDEELVALQAADMLAWHVNRDLDFPGENRPIYRKITPVLSHREIGPEGLRDFVEMAKYVSRTEFDTSL